jgi:hypothetical protein
LTIKSTSPATRSAWPILRPDDPACLYTCRRYFFALRTPLTGHAAFKTCVLYARQYSIVKEQESSQPSAISFQLKSFNLAAESC